MTRTARRFGRSLKPFRRPWLWAGLWSLAKSGMTLSDLRGQVRRAREEGA